MNKPPHIGIRNAKIQQTIAGLLIGAAISLGGCATTGITEQQNIANKVDPYENFNRKMFVFNDAVDDYVASPISDAYKWVTPQFMQTGVYNFFNNLKDINVVINDVLQAKFAQSAHDTGRFALNTTMGLGGFVDVASHVGLPRNEEDFEQTLAVWGVPQGSYLVIPFLGPSTVRGIPGSAFDTAANPASYVGFPVQLISLLNTRANAEGALKFIDEAALDPYVFTRESFLQWRNNLATDGKSESSLDLDDGLSEDSTAPAAKTGDTGSANKKVPALHANTETK
jgi:phospholipid-binding lipoprotein MlaA